MTIMLHRVARKIADYGFTAAIVGMNEIQTDAPENVCKMAVDTILQEMGGGGTEPTIRRRKRRAAPDRGRASHDGYFEAAAKPKRRRRRKTTTQLRRKLRAAKIKAMAMLRRESHGKHPERATGRFRRAFRAESKAEGQLIRRKARKPKRTAKRRTRKTWTAAARSAFARKMAAARAFYRKAKR
jgi:hypothetical protein